MITDAFWRFIETDGESQTVLVGSRQYIIRGKDGKVQLLVLDSYKIDSGTALKIAKENCFAYNPVVEVGEWNGRNIVKITWDMPAFIQPDSVQPGDMYMWRNVNGEFKTVGLVQKKDTNLVCVDGKWYYASPPMGETKILRFHA